MSESNQGEGKRPELEVVRADDIRQDLAFQNLRHEVDQDIRDIRTELREDIRGLKDDIRENRVERQSNIREDRVERQSNLRWLIALGFALAGIIVTLTSVAVTLLAEK